MYDYIGIVIADGCEYEPMRDYALSVGGKKDSIGGMECVRFECAGIRLTVILSGVGKVNAAGAAAFLISDGAQLLLSSGYSGGISGAPRGATALASGFIEHDFDLTPLGYEKAAKPDQVYFYKADEYASSVARQLYPNLAEGVMVSGDCFVSDDRLRDELRERYNAVACDMESAAVASVAYKCGIGTLALRRISDDAGDDASNIYVEAYETAMTDMLIGIVKRIAEGQNV